MRDEGLGFKARGIWFRVQELGFRVWGWGLGTSD